MSLLRPLALLSSLLLLSQAQAGECEIYAPAPEKFVEMPEWTREMFVGRIVALRMNDTSLATEAPSCPRWGAPDASEECQNFWSSVVSVQFSVEAAIKGVNADQTFETVVVNTDDPCYGLSIGQLWLIMDHLGRRIQLGEMPSPAVIESLRKRAGE